MEHVQRHREPWREIRVEALLERVEHGVRGDIRLGARRPLTGVMVLVVLVVVLARVVVVVVSRVQIKDIKGAADAVLSQLFQFKTLAVFAANVHQQ